MRVIAFGCSYTYGHGLPDCHIDPNKHGEKPSKFAWPNIIASQLNVECINASMPGASNKRIWDSILNFKFKEGDIVFVLWSFVDRSCLFLDSKNIKQIGPWLADCEIYYKDFYSDYDSLLMSQLFVSHANYHLTKKRITVHNMCTESKSKNIFKLGNNKIPYIDIYLDSFKENFAYALDKLHPGVECHHQFAKLICEKINITNNLSEIKKISFFKKIHRWLINDRFYKNTL